MNFSACEGMHGYLGRHALSGSSWHHLAEKCGQGMACAKNEQWSFRSNSRIGAKDPIVSVSCDNGGNAWQRANKTITREMSKSKNFNCNLKVTWRF